MVVFRFLTTPDCVADRFECLWSVMGENRHPRGIYHRSTNSLDCKLYILFVSKGGRMYRKVDGCSENDEWIDALIHGLKLWKEMSGNVQYT